ncbi:hypothetical protein SBRCBS47491_006438 [Sporothrix bragantina]|uniref:Uncharacterized protein n=1 Tax=Sporothrix bragantina TaxID=671064 RepID=A0ABP0C4X9_9PEZI
MHYIRLLRPPNVVHAVKAPSRPGQGGSSLGLVLTITTDLGESFLCPDEPIRLAVELFVDTVEKQVDKVEDEVNESGDDGEGTYENEMPPPKEIVRTHIFELPLMAPSTAPAGKAGKGGKPSKAAAAAGGDASSWRAGMRVLKAEAKLSKDAEACLWGSHSSRSPTAILKRRICIRTADKKLSATCTKQLVETKSGGNGYDDGLIMPLWVDVPETADETFPHVALRQLLLDDDVAAKAGDKSKAAASVEVEEEIGESIARHVWDAGLTQKQNKTLRVLELGSGVGILGIGLAAIVQEASRRGSAAATAEEGNAIFLLTDLPEAEEHARTNMARSGSTSLDYENLDWEDGRQGHFGPAVAGDSDGNDNAWDLVVLSDCTYNVDMLPALVETLTALPSKSDTKGAKKPSVLLARKPRHASEEALFSLMTDHGWTVRANSTVPLSVLDGDAQVVELYLYEMA